MTGLAATSTGEIVWSLAILPVWVVLAKLFGLYDRDQMSIRHLTVDELPQIAAWSAAGTAMLGALLYVTPVPTLHRRPRGDDLVLRADARRLSARRDALALAPHHAVRS